MSNGLTSFVPVLTGPNYLQWAPKMQAFLQTTGRWMQPMTKTCPTLVATPSNQDKADAWNEDDTAARGSIRLRVDDSIGTAIDSKTTAKQVWDYLKDTYGKPGIPVVYQDFRAAMGISIPSDSNPIPAMDKRASLRRKLPLLSNWLPSTSSSSARKGSTRTSSARMGSSTSSSALRGSSSKAIVVGAEDAAVPSSTKGEMDTLPQSRDPRALLHKPVRAETGANHQYPALRRAFTLAKELGVEPTTERIRKLEMLVVAGNRSKDPVLTPTTELHSTRSSPESSATYSEDSRTTSPNVSRSPTPFAGNSVRIVEVDSGEDTDGEEHAAKRRRRTLKERIRPHLRERIGAVVEDEDMEETVSLGLSSEDEHDDDIEEFFDRQCASPIVGIPHYVQQREREAVAAKRAEQKAIEEERRRQKAYLSDLESSGIRKLAALQVEREAEENEDEHYLEASLASGYSHTSLATRPRRSASVDVESSTTDSSNEESSENDEPVALTQKRARAPKKTRAELVREKRAKITAQIDDAAESQAKTNKGKQPAGKKAAETSRLFSQTAPSDQQNDVYDSAVYTAAYRAKLAASASAQVPKPGASRPGTPTTQRPPVSASNTASTTPRPSALHFRTSSSSHPATPLPTRRATSIHPGAPASAQHSDDEINLGSGGFNDEDVTITHDSVIGRPRGRQPELVAVTRVDPEPKVKPKRKRTAKADMDPKKSRSANNIEGWLRDDFDSTILPSVIHYFGAQKDPWKLDVHDGEQGSAATTAEEKEVAGLVDILQDIIDHLYPRRQHQITIKDRVVAVTRQRVMNWRRGFMTRAHNAVKAAVDDWKKANPDATVDERAMWAKTALHRRRGVAWWELPKSDRNPKPEGPLMTPYILKTFGPHFKYISGSILADVGEPVGALSLTCAAVEIAFKCYKSGKYATPDEDFDAKNAGEGTDGFGESTIQAMLDDADIWEEFMQRARQHAPRGFQSAKERSPPRSRQRNIFASSSPVRGDESA
ncbi:hypothetical protein GSI_01453 [Ganoderma sinense ZZ0214-1]|uniref:DUF4219 domain-containing protein n=1 Tax=Ganoderma sinense ZZ0214-1 TaxID=1077348 RepID=A0A2G8SVG3_9APHY|nr:hypothetical protein GSI_01453 [Ganoderma sinense ZZ0214-1]